ncbi:MAG: sugar transferase [Gemmatimonadetes bacterium]|uniref:Sugar transferase n=1 Tax=Candidatus Kutchimonas denitrificans TaxID=3056748 RepID=A0AAE4Z698_9BACT|nr:sugar transferase [Gemmatimonadota bacterium]NIR73798.1 sugar transferase [Candidatus Kutchimonas denitrificans]NIS03162.1 sugar transferase [Gemmatimonadota bacterium]NIT69063.1 sugar transferase [Gemmatimonadota bacterium]NIU54154.1 exopolysaccharide biosynthesis polyprenyl glycosylphosphotransferase [Gemmatimonadota bacterium]
MSAKDLARMGADTSWFKQTDESGEPIIPGQDIRLEIDRVWRRRLRERLRRIVRVTSLMLGDSLAVMVGLVLAGAMAAATIPINPVEGVSHYFLPPNTIPAFLILQILVLAAAGAYGSRTVQPYVRVGLASVMGSVIFFTGLHIYSSLALTTEPITLAGSSALLFLLSGRKIARGSYRRLRRAGVGLRKVALITTPDGAVKDAARIARERDNRVRVCETIVVERPTNGGREWALRAIDRVSRDASLAGIVLSVDTPPGLVRAVVCGCKERGLPIFCVPPFLQEFSPDVRPESDGPLRFLELVRPAPKLPEMTVKRVIDVVGATLGLVLLAPVIFVLAVLIKLDSPGPAFFWQTRVGLGGRPFRMLKLRTMVAGADSQKKALAHLNGSGDWRLFKVATDPRVTRFGRFLRRYSLDEVPQLWNVIRGEMSLVGPRPFFIDDLEFYESHHFRRYSVLPGITGEWQVNGRSHVKDFDAVVAKDLHYIRNWSIGRDISILLKTLPAVIRGEGAM